MKKSTLLHFIFCALMANSLSAQLIVKPAFFETTGVSNLGLVAGYEAQAGPYSVWNPDTNIYINIGGAAPGQGIGGQARFSSDGNFISGSNIIDHPLSTVWSRNILPNEDYIFKAIEFPENQNYWGYSAGTSLTNEGNGILLRTVNGGVTWAEKWVDTSNRGLEAMSFPLQFTGYVGGWNHYFAKTTDGGDSWIELNPAGLDNVYVYKTINFKDEFNGVVTAQLDGGTAVYITADAGETWTTGSGLTGVPQKVCYVEGDTYYLVNNAGDIQKSVDNGFTWTTVFTSTTSLYGINFYDNLIGIATSDRFVYKTIDGGTTWNLYDVFEGARFRDVKWIDDAHLVLVGTPDLIFESTDGGENWSWDNQTIFNGNPALYAIAVTDSDVHVCGSQGNFYKKSLLSSIAVAEMSRYDSATQQWSSLGNLGFIVDNNTSAGWCISGDGHSVAGNSWANPANGNGSTPYAHGFVWNETEGTIDLGSLYANQNRSSRANAISGDGNVVVGYQDLNGPWKSAVWRKNPAGGYFPNEYLLINPNGDATDEYNQIGECSYVTQNGNWIGGYGDYANAYQPWIWSQQTGVINLGVVEGAMITNGNVSGISPDGSMVIGWFDQDWGMPAIPFIWTATNGIQNFNDFVQTTLNFDLGDNQVYIPNCMSNNGKYIAGWGVNPTASEFGELFTFRIELPDTLGVHPSELEATAIYPNPVNTILNIKTSPIMHTITIYSITGQLLASETSQAANDHFDMSAYSKGTYIVKVNSDNDTKTYKVVKF